MENLKSVNPELVQEILERHGLDWAVKKEPLGLPDGTDSGFYGIVRQDNRHTFAAAKESYEVFQNWELAELVLRVAQELGEVPSHGGTFNSGGQTYLQIKRPTIEVNGDRIKQMATAINSFDLSTALRWGGTGTTISCMNTFHMVYRGLQNSVKHTKNMRQAVEQSVRIIQAIDEANKSLIDTLMQFGETKSSKEQVVQVIQAVTGVDANKPEADAREEYSTRKLNKAKALIESIGSEMSSKGQTLWGLWSGMTHFTSHKAGSDNAREKSKAMGSLQKADVEVFELLKSFIA